MKTITEFSGFQLRSVFDLKRNLIQKKRTAGSPAPATETAETKSEEAAPAVSESTEANPEQTAAPVNEEASAPTDTPVSSEPAPVPSAEVKPQKAIVEVSTEELLAALGEALKLEGEKLTHVLNALGTVDPRRVTDLKRVVVYSLSEGERGPAGSTQKEAHAYLPEYLAPLHRPRGNRPPGKGGRPRGKGRNDKNKRGGKGGGRGDQRGPGGRPQSQDREFSRKPGNNGRPGGRSAPSQS